MDKKLLSKLKEITEEEYALLNGDKSVKQELYTASKEFVIDSKKLLEKGQYIQFRPHTRFAHFPNHRHNYVEMLYMCSGSTTHIVNNNTTLVLNEGDILFMNQNVYHEILPAGADDIAINFIILPAFFDKPLAMIEENNILRDFLISTISEGNSANTYLHFQTKGILPINNLIENMIWTILNKTPLINSTIQTTMGLLFMNLSHYSDTLKKDDPNQYDQNIVFSVLQYIETHYKKGSLEDIASDLGLPTYAISRTLKKHTGSNFKELLQTRKLQQAVYYLKQTNLSIDDIMENIGYNNSSYFYNIFKKKYACSPKDFRDNGITSYF